MNNICSYRVFLLLFLSSACSFAMAIDPAVPTYGKELQLSLQKALLAKGKNYQPRTEHLNDDGSPLFTNRLILESSPYLIQHAHNPVNWYPWGDEALAKAKETQKPIFLSIGYSTCHWCHVMERESFENKEVARLLNQHFISIKVDRERRPDIDSIYMTAVTLITGRGGWPMSSFLTPEGKTFIGGTYYPKDQFLGLLDKIRLAWNEQRPALEQQANQIFSMVSQRMQRTQTAREFSKNGFKATADKIIQSYDSEFGGFSAAPKFPNESLLLYLLRSVEREPNASIQQAIDGSLDAMARGGIYDQVAGGFHRYSTDGRWLVPHFEKMLYNQAQMALVYLRAYRTTGNSFYARIANQTLDYVLREMAHPKGGFYSATDADSNGVEGAYFVWKMDELKAVLPDELFEFSKRFYGVTEQENFDDENILHISQNIQRYLNQQQLSEEALYQQMDAMTDLLYQVRRNRVAPLRDDKILSSWNGMIIFSLAEAAFTLADNRYKKAAIRAADYIWNTMRKQDGRLWRSALNDRASIDGLQEDYAYFSLALIQLYDVTGDAMYLDRAEQLVLLMVDDFSDPAGGFFMSDLNGMNTVLRPKDSVDNAIPSGNSIALSVLSKLAIRTSNNDYLDRANLLLNTYATDMQFTPIAYGAMLSGADQLLNEQMGALQYAARGAVRVHAYRMKSSPKIRLSIDIKPQWHINSDQPLQDDLIATQVRLLQPKGLRLRNTVYPKADIVTLGFRDDQLSLYQGRIVIELEFSNLQDIAFNLGSYFGWQLEFQVQACNETTCLPPELLKLSPINWQ